MTIALKVFAWLLMWAVVIFGIGLAVSSYRRARREARPLPPWWFWAVIATLGVVLGIVISAFIDRR